MLKLGNLFQRQLLGSGTSSAVLQVNSDLLILLCRLHWFLEQQRADFKTLVMMVRCILGNVYLLSLIYF
jgi:hypothetical protein